MTATPTPIPEECKHDFRPYPSYPWGETQQCCICGTRRDTPKYVLVGGFGGNSPVSMNTRTGQISGGPVPPPSPTPEEIEAAARALARKRIELNARFEKPPKTEDFIQKCIGYNWPNFADDAEIALKAAMAVRRGK